MTINQQNPLAKYFRLPGVHVTIPTKGAFMPPGSIEFTITGELPVYPMRSADEMLLKSPEALMNGFAIEELLKSCVPTIKYPRLVSNIDLDVLLLAIRTATFGEVIEVSTHCPSCGEENEAQLNLTYIMSTMQTVDPENIVRLTDEILVYLRPYSVENTIVIGTASFEEARLIQAAEAQEDEKIKQDQINASMKRISLLSETAMADCILKVISPDGEIENKEFIHEFVQNISKSWTDKIAAKLEEINKKGIDKGYDMKCAKCEHEWRPEIEFNPTTFFVTSS